MGMQALWFKNGKVVGNLGSEPVDALGKGWSQDVLGRKGRNFREGEGMREKRDKLVRDCSIPAYEVALFSGAAAGMTLCRIRDWLLFKEEVEDKTPPTSTTITTNDLGVTTAVTTTSPTTTTITGRGRPGHSTKRKITPEIRQWMGRRCIDAPTLKLLDLQRELLQLFGLSMSVASVSRIRLEALNELQAIGAASSDAVAAASNPGRAIRRRKSLPQSKPDESPNDEEPK